MDKKELQKGFKQDSNMITKYEEKIGGGGNQALKNCCSNPE